MEAHKLYQVKPFPGSSHNWASRTLQTISPDARVLDIGAGSGIIGAQLKERGITNLVAVDTCPATREHLKSIYAEVYEDVGKLKGRQYDIILLLDVLEHMADPFTFLKDLAPLVAPNGKILISVPNIAHWGVRIPLLFGFFNYTKRGLLDETHLQFFNRRRFITLVKQPGFRVNQFSSSIPPFEFVLPRLLWDNAIFRTFSAFHLFLAKFLPGFFAYQHLGVIEKY